MIQEILEKVKKEWRDTLKNFGIKPKEAPTMMMEQKSIYEINLVPEVKRKMIKAMKFRNLMLFLAIILVSAAGGSVLICASIWEGQNIAMSSQDGSMKMMSDKLNSFSGLSELLTIQSQLEDLNTINQKKKVLSRVFPILSVILPSGPDTIQISELSVDLVTNTLRFDAQADAKVSPYIDYRVLESFKKGISLMKYDYGRYVTAEDSEIPSRCLVETDENGNMLTEEENVNGTINKYTYVYWLKGKKDCDPERDDYNTENDEEDEQQTQTASNKATISQVLKDLSVTSTEDTEDNNQTEEQKIRAEFDAMLEKMNDYEKSLAYQQLNNGAKMQNIDVVKIYRSPKFSDWYDKGYMSEDGEISGVPHFDSQCITYSGITSGNNIKWSSTNDCMLADGEAIIRDSSNGRDSKGNLVLRFNATITLNENVFLFINKNVMAISPTSQNVTDSYRQIEGMFAERAADCTDSDVVCTSASTGDNSGTSNNGSGSDTDNTGEEEE